MGSTVMLAVYDSLGYFQTIVEVEEQDIQSARHMYRHRRHFKTRAHSFLNDETAAKIDNACPNGVGEIVKI